MCQVKSCLLVTAGREVQRRVVHDGTRQPPLINDIRIKRFIGREILRRLHVVVHTQCVPDFMEDQVGHGVVRQALIELVVKAIQRFSRQAAETGV